MSPKKQEGGRNNEYEWRMGLCLCRTGETDDICIDECMIMIQKKMTLGILLTVAIVCLCVSAWYAMAVSRRTEQRIERVQAQLEERSDQHSATVSGVFAGLAKEGVP